MALLNLVAILLPGRVEFTVIGDYEAHRGAGKEPVFDRTSIPGVTDAIEQDVWVPEVATRDA